MLLPRDTISEIKPHESADATADESATRHAMFENGTNTVKSHE